MKVLQITAYQIKTIYRNFNIAKIGLCTERNPNHLAGLLSYNTENVADLVRIPLIPKLLLFVEFKTTHLCRGEIPRKLVVRRNKL